MSNTIAKQALSEKDLQVLNSEFDKKKKSKGLAYLIWFFLGGFGGHRFYIGDTGRGVAMLLLNWITLGIWSLVDAFVLSGRIDKINDEIENKIINEIA